MLGLVKLRAFAIHLTASVAVVGAYLALVYFVWYPEPFHRLERVIDVVAILIGVDVVIGPLLTFVVYNPAKKELRRDLAVIVVLQIAAFLWGASVAYGQRPVYVALVSHTLSVVGANNVDQSELRDASLRSSGWGGPRFVVVDIEPETPDMKAAIERAAATSKKIATRADRYAPLEAYPQRLADSAIDIDAHVREYPELAAPMDRFLAKNGGTRNDYYLVAVEGRIGFQFFLFRRSDWAFVGMLDPS